MGMYSDVIKNSNLTIHPALKRYRGNIIQGEDFNSFLNMGTDIKFYGYFSEDMLSDLNHIARKKLVEGSCEVYYEEGITILCEFAEDGFKFKHGKIVFSDEYDYDGGNE